MEVKKVEVEPFHKIKDDIITKLKKGYYETSLEEYDKAKKDLLNIDELEWNKKALDQLVDERFYPNRAEAIRVAIRDMISVEVWRRKGVD